MVMSVFFKNFCSFPSCKRNFYTLSDLIQHIEHEHLDFDPIKLEQLEEEKPESLPLSYVLKYSTEEMSYNKNEISYESVIPNVEDMMPQVSTYNNNYLDCDFSSMEIGLDDDFPQIIGGNKLFTFDYKHKKPFTCTMKGCEKRYKNINGMKYHYKKHHKMSLPIVKKNQMKHKTSLLKSKADKRDLYSLPMYNYNDLYQPHDDYFYNVPTSDLHLNQVPLSKMSFNYYEEELAKSTYFLPNKF